ncbi:MAG: DEAD/DEAH box helicase [Chloroflexi bacterium]|nr:DEAD/DEAH box helicase [Chloroflexota bacterium]
MLARQRIVPVLEQEELGFAAGWRAVLDSPRDAERLATLGKAMPPICRSLEAAGEPPRGVDLVVDFLNSSVDALTRSWLAETVPRGGWQAHGHGTSAPDAWLSSLGRGDRSVRAADFELERVVHRLEEWRAPLASVASGSAYRTCFRLSPPDDPAAERPLWDLEILLQAPDDPSLLVPAARVWQERGAALSYLNRRLDRPQERLLADLGRAARAFPPLDRALAHPHPERCVLSTEEAYSFLREAAWLLEEQGFGVLVPSWWDRRGPRNSLGARVRLRPAGASSAGSSNGSFTGQALVDYDWRLALGDVELTEEEFHQLAALKVPLICVRGQWVELRADRVEQAISFWERQRQAQQTQLTTAEALKLALGSDEADGLPILGVDAEGWIANLLGSLDAQAVVQPMAAPPDFQGFLRPYQERGVGWLTFLRTCGLGACLADDMGLGKTIQYVAFLLHQRARRGATRPALLICPTSVVANWVHELERFAPSIKALVHHGPARLNGKAFAETVEEQDLVLSSYALVHRDRDLLASIEWDGIVLDEAQNVKNAATRQSQAVRSLKGGYRVAMTGTPVENRLAELWSIFEFLNPGYLGSQEAFRRRFALPIERWQDAERAEQLRALVRPLVLRRVKSDPTIIQDLPDKLEMKVYCSLTAEQASLYQAVVTEMLSRIEASEGIERRGRVLAALTRLKQVCNHPAQLLGDGSSLPGRSGKLIRLEEMLEEVLSTGERALIFTQFAEFGELLRQALQARFGQEVLFLHGGVPARRRDEMVTRFQQDAGGPRLFILSLKAGGVGLNLTRANHVFHVDRWWNPAVENQATDRAFRIGQQRNVQVRKLICLGTLEERIDELIESKRALAEQVVGSGESWLTELSTAELRELLSLRNEALVGE